MHVFCVFSKSVMIVRFPMADFILDKLISPLAPTEDLIQLFTVCNSVLTPTSGETANPIQMWCCVNCPAETPPAVDKTHRGWLSRANTTRRGCARGNEFAPRDGRCDLNDAAKRDDITPITPVPSCGHTVFV